MTHPSFQTNGASLEDCHTNFFALTDLCGIKWRKLTFNESSSVIGGNILEDPILLSYSRCLANDILCVWRRVSSVACASGISSSVGLFDLNSSVPSPTPPPLSLGASKELWIFWYGEEPNFSALISPELLATSENEHGSWESGLSYECRSLLFKALHNLIERYLLSRDFVRLGKWFVLPYDESTTYSSNHLSFAFAFFVHGESTVCTSIDVRQHPAVRRITSSRLEWIQSSQSQIKVILAPYGLAGTFTGKIYRNGSQIIDEWRHFYPINKTNSFETSTENMTPMFVEVSVSGVRMRYPTCYVLLTDFDNDYNKEMSTFSTPINSLQNQNEEIIKKSRLFLSADFPEHLSFYSSNFLIRHAIMSDLNFIDPTNKSFCTCFNRFSQSHAVQTYPDDIKEPPAGSNYLKILSVESSNSQAPSPVPTPHSDPTSITTIDPLMPTLSPQQLQNRIIINSTISPIRNNKNLISNNNPISTQVQRLLLKRPVLSIQKYENVFLQDEEYLPWLYDYATQEAWLNHPVKRFRNSENDQQDSFNNNIDSKQRLSFIFRTPNLSKDSKLEKAPKMNESLDLKSDPYEFEISGDENNCIDTIKWEKEDNIKPSSLFTSEGLQASYKDLDQIFDNSDSSSDDTNIIHSQELNISEITKYNNISEDNKNENLVKQNHRGILTLKPEELSKMFPTPPSLEQNSVMSPSQFCDLAQESNEFNLSNRTLRQNSDMHFNMGSPPEKAIEDWSHVFKPPTIFSLVSSSKYSPLKNLSYLSFTYSTLPSSCLYRSSWYFNSETTVSDKNILTTKSNTIQQTTPQLPQHLYPRSPSALNLPYRPSILSRQCLQPYDEPSPATSTSSYFNKNLNSIESENPVTQRSSESNSLLVNILLSDTSLNIFRDHNFNSSSICVCNAGPKVVGNIKGADAGAYLVNTNILINTNIYHEEDQIRCSCGFSAVMNRRLAHNSGLFYEDEMEITGLAEDPSINKQNISNFLMSKVMGSVETNDTLPSSIIDLLKDQCYMMQSSANSLFRAAKFRNSNTTLPSINFLDFNDGNEISLAAIDQCKTDQLPNDQNNRLKGMHKWSFLHAKGPECSGDIIRIMRSLQPLLQEAVQRKTTRMWEAPYTVTGPLTWRQFHRLAGRGADDRCEPQPIPTLIVGYDRDWLSLSPYALNYWEKLLLEPYAGSKDIVYLVVLPDSNSLLPIVNNFFRELSTTYEICRFGKHTPIRGNNENGVLRIGNDATNKFFEYQDKENSYLQEENTIIDVIRSYAQICCHNLSICLSQAIEKNNIDNVEAETCLKSNVNNSTSIPNNTIVSQENPGNKMDSVDITHADSATNVSLISNNQVAGSTNMSLGSTTISSANLGSPDVDEKDPPTIVVYLVEAFSFYNSISTNIKRQSVAGLLYAYSVATSKIPENIRANINLQVVSLEGLLELNKVNEKRKFQDELRVLATNVFLQCRRLLNHYSNVRSLTGFGTAAAADLFLKNKDSQANLIATTLQDENSTIYKLYGPAYILAPLRVKSEAPESFGISGPEECSILYLSYCLSENQSWLLAVATDDRGEIYETAIINIDIPNRRKRKNASARRSGLQKLMDFIIGIMSQGVIPWRLVVGRVGKIGHGELKGWSWLLSRKSLIKVSKQLKEICGQCSLLYPTASPCVLSACLVSLEPDSNLRLMSDQFTPDERFSQTSVNCQLSTPRDVTCTHILVFPTSATTQSSQTAFQEQHINGPELGDDELFSALNDDMPEGMEGMGDFNDIFNVWQEPGVGGAQSPTGSPHRTEGSPINRDICGTNVENHDSQGSPFSSNNNARVTMTEPIEEVGTLLQQPLALGYLVSTAPTGQMPTWFWASCPHLEGVCPVFIKNALHLHSMSIQQNSDDLLQQQSSLVAHPLDSQYTTDVLRYVLEGYNALSWLSIDINTKDRISCLPIHVQALMQLYHVTAALL